MSPMCSEGSPRNDLVCPECLHPKTVTILNGSVLQCCGFLGGCGYTSLNEEDFWKVEQKMDKWAGAVIF